MRMRSDSSDSNSSSDDSTDTRTLIPEDRHEQPWTRRGVGLARTGKVEFTKVREDGVNINPPRCEISKDGELGPEKKSNSDTAFIIWFDDDTVWDGRDGNNGQSFDLEEFLFPDEIEEYKVIKEQNYNVEQSDSSDLPSTSSSSRLFVVRRFSPTVKTILAIDSGSNTYTELRPVDKLDYENLSGCTKKEATQAWRGVRLPAVFEPSVDDVLIPDEFGHKLNVARQHDDPTRDLPLLFSKLKGAKLPKALNDFIEQICGNSTDAERFLHVLAHHVQTRTRAEVGFLFVGVPEKLKRQLIEILTYIYGPHMTTVLSGEDRMSADTQWMGHTMLPIWYGMDGPTPSTSDKIHSRITAMMTFDTLIPRAPHAKFDEVSNRALTIIFNQYEPRRHSIHSFDRLNVLEFSEQIKSTAFLQRTDLAARQLYAYLQTVVPDPKYTEFGNDSELKREIAKKQGSDIDVYNRDVINNIIEYIQLWDDKLDNPTDAFQKVPPLLGQAIDRNKRVIDSLTSSGLIYFKFEELCHAYRLFCPLIRQAPELAEARGLRTSWRESLGVTTTSKYLNGEQVRGVFWTVTKTGSGTICEVHRS